MLQQVKHEDLIKGQQYFVIHCKGAIVEGDLIYDGYSFFKYPNSIQSFQMFTRLYHFYRYVSKYEYYMALKEKYDATCLDIVLKRVVNENFSW